MKCFVTQIVYQKFTCYEYLALLKHYVAIEMAIIMKLCWKSKNSIFEEKKNHNFFYFTTSIDNLFPQIPVARRSGMPIRAFKLDNITHQMKVEDVDRHAVNAFKRVLKLESTKFA